MKKEGQKPKSIDGAMMLPIIPNWWKSLAYSKKVSIWVVKGLLFSLLLSISACSKVNKPQEGTAREPISASTNENRLTLNNAVLEQSNPEGGISWKVKAANTTYSPDREAALLEDIVANILQDGEIILRASAKIGQIEKNGEEIILKEDIIATYPRNQVVIRANEARWYPKQNLLIVRDNLRGNHPKLDIWANEGRFYLGKQRLELRGKIVAVAKEEPIRMKAEYLYWDISAQKAIGEPPLTEDSKNYRPPQMWRYKGDEISEVVYADRFEVDLNTDTVTLKDNVRVKSADPPVQIATNSLIWKYKQDLITSDKPVKIVHSQAKITVTGNQGTMDLEKEIAHLKGGVRGINTSDRATLYSNELIWSIPNRTIEAIGNVVYEQTDPAFNVTGVKAVGQLAKNKVIVTGDRGKRVVTKIFP
ncbi:MAG: LPS export ABC transporter periplasmic protein LptC [Prochloraceae cyanobacterium]|nr:LPS export ABC transporter periplasmic protein LptC [Prochloraceae cyanobacterium]